MIEIEDADQDPLEEKVARDTLERYSGAEPDLFQSHILLTNFYHYVQHFAQLSGQKIHQGSTMSSCHWPDKNISILDYKVGSPAAALAIDMLSFLSPKACLMLGLCGGLRRKYQVGDLLLPVAAIRGEGTSDFYFPPAVPALSNFMIQRTTSEVLDTKKIPYHVGIVHTTNIRFWEFSPNFRQQLIDEKVQGIEMECATLFAAGYRRNVPVGALLLVSDLPLNRDGIKTKELAQSVNLNFSQDHVIHGIDVLEYLIEHSIDQHP